ncbi:protein HASTY 1-like [Phalaenopsis equestris]|uniref:protein HASTY 1-like n=1 Tax=Phalaenopsis equestris TaxID=78828 RepID=UPI0009E22DF5|nr:protein HASTY 1-like [Phalaenopsis equestris]
MEVSEGSCGGWSRWSELSSPRALTPLANFGSRWQPLLATSCHCSLQPTMFSITIDGLHSRIGQRTPKALPKLVKYNVIGLSANIGDCFFRGFDCSILTMALMENVQSMDFRHIRQLIHLVLVPIVKLCPADLRVQWLENLLHPLFLHCQQALSYSWSSFMHEGRAKVPDTFISLPDIELKLEVMEEKLLRDLTREICNLLLVLASPALNSGLPSLEQLGNVNRTESSSLNSLDAFSTNSIMGFLLTHKSLALPALRICIEAFTWTDGEAVAKVASFCEAVILLAISTDNVELREFVVKDLFYAILQALFLESNAVISSDLVGLCREIYVYLSHRDSSPRQILLSLPFLTEGDLVAFEDALSKTSSPKEQKLLMRSLLQLATGNKLRALACQKSTSIITNVTATNVSSNRFPSWIGFHSSSSSWNRLVIHLPKNQSDGVIVHQYCFLLGLKVPASHHSQEQQQQQQCHEEVVRGKRHLLSGSILASLCAQPDFNNISATAGVRFLHLKVVSEGLDSIPVVFLSRDGVYFPHSLSSSSPQGSLLQPSETVVDAIFPTISALQPTLPAIPSLSLAANTVPATIYPLPFPPAVVPVIPNHVPIT